MITEVVVLQVHGRGAPEITTHCLYREMIHRVQKDFGSLDILVSTGHLLPMTGIPCKQTCIQLLGHHKLTRY